MTTQTMRQCSEWLSYSDACEYANLSRGFLYKRIVSGELPAYKAGRIVRIHRGDLDTFLRQHRAAVSPVGEPLEEAR